MKRRSCLAAVGSSLLGACTASTSSGGEDSSSLLFGGGKGSQPAEVMEPEYLGLNVGNELNWTRWRGKLIPYYRNAGVRWLRVWYNWETVETEPGQYDRDYLLPALNLAKMNGFRICFMIWGTPPFAGNGGLNAVPDQQALRNYCLWLRSTLDSVVDAWEVWNETNLDKYYQGSPEDYIQTLATAYEVLAGEGPVVAAGTSGAAKPAYWQAMIDAGLEQHCDRVNMHPYRDRPDQVVALVDDFLSRVNKPLWITELGLSSDKYDEQAKAEFVEALLPLLSDRVETLMWYRSIQGKGMHPLRYGLLDVDKPTGQIAQLPAYQAYQSFARQYQEA